MAMHMRLSCPGAASRLCVPSAGAGFPTDTGGGAHRRGGWDLGHTPAARGRSHGHAQTEVPGGVLWLVYGGELVKNGSRRGTFRF